ncbi:MAG: hypothetical protein ABIH22_01990 [Candidatus Margulisiibacteriota bacterium]
MKFLALKKDNKLGENFYMIKVARNSRTYLIAVHLDQKAKEFHQTAKLWGKKNLFADRIHISSGYHPHPFPGEGHEIQSSNGMISPGSFPAQITNPAFVLVGGLLAEKACLSRAFDSLIARGYYRKEQTEINMPLDCIYSSPRINKLAYAPSMNSFGHAFASYFEGKDKITLDGKLLFGHSVAVAALNWFSTVEMMLFAHNRVSSTQHHCPNR